MGYMHIQAKIGIKLNKISALKIKSYQNNLIQFWLKNPNRKSKIRRKRRRDWRLNKKFYHKLSK
jgi:hypothetical protein